MPKYCTVDGRITTAENPNRALWYGQCGFWCDDWDKLKLIGPGIPACPHCATPGFICTAAQWFDSAKRLDSSEPGYLEFLTKKKETCLRDVPGGLTTAWDTHKAAARDIRNLKLIPEEFTRQHQNDWKPEPEEG